MSHFTKSIALAALCAAGCAGSRTALSASPAAPTASAPEPTAAASTPAPALTSQVVLLLPEQVFAQRCDVEPLGATLKAIMAEVDAASRGGDGAQQPFALYVAVKPERRGRVWIEGLDGDLPAATRDRLVQRTSAVAFPEVHGGPIALAIVYVREGEMVRVEQLRLPADWRRVIEAAARPLATDDVVRLAWPD